MALGGVFAPNPFTNTKPKPVGTPLAPAPLTDAQQQGMALANTQYGPQMAGFQTQADLIAGQIGYAGSSADLQRQMLEAQYGQSAANNALGYQGIDLDRAGLALQREGIGLNRNDLGLQRQSLGLNRSDLGLQRESLGVSGKDITLQETNADTLRNLAEQLYGINTTAANQASQHNIQNIKSDNTSRGSTNTPGYGRSLDWNNKDLANQLASLGIGNQKDIANYQQTKGLLGNQREQLGIKGRGLDIQGQQLDIQGQQLDIQGQRYDLSEKELDIQNKQLDLKAQGLGISGAALKTNLEQALQKMGLDQFMTLNDLTRAWESNDLQKRALADEIYRTGLQYSDMFAGNTPTPARNSLAGYSSNPAAESQPQTVNGVSSQSVPPLFNNQDWMQ